MAGTSDMASSVKDSGSPSRSRTSTRVPGDSESGDMKSEIDKDNIQMKYDEDGLGLDLEANPEGLQEEEEVGDQADRVEPVGGPPVVSSGSKLHRPNTRISIKDDLNKPSRLTQDPRNVRPPPEEPLHPAEEPAPPQPPLVRSTSTGSNRPYSAFSGPTKWLIVSLSGIAGVFSPISSNIFVPAIPTLSAAFHRSDQDISLAITVYLIFQAWTPSIFGSMSDSFGRRPIYIGTLMVYMGANLGLALMPTTKYWLLLFLRILQATGGSAVVSIGAGCVSDIAEPRERGKFYAIFQLGAMIGPAFGPLLGGIFAGALGWRSIFWFLFISCGVVLVPVIFFLPESLRSIVGDGSIPPPFINMTPTMMLQKRKLEREHKAKGEAGEHVERPPKKKYQPLSAFMILFNPEICLTFVFVSLLYTEFYCILTLYSTALKNTYGLDNIKIGLAYLPNGVGSIVASQINGRQLDWYYRKEERRVGGDYRKKGEAFDIEWTRLRCILPFMAVFIIGCTALGWCLEAKAPLAATLVVGFFVGLGTGTISTSTLYGQDLMPGKGGAVSASLNLVRCVFGAVGTAVIQLIYNAIGAGWTTTLLSGLCIAGLPVYWLVIKRGRIWREKRKARAEQKRLEKERVDEEQRIESNGGVDEKNQ